MYLFYFDEVKYDPPTQDSWWLGGIGVRSTNASEIEEQVTALAETQFGTSQLKRGTEFHGKEICQQKGAFKGVALETRLQLIASLCEILDRPEIEKFYIRIRPENIVAAAEPPEEIAFMYMVEQINRFLKKNDEVGMIFGDYDDPVIGPSVASLSRFRRHGTDWARSIKIDRLVDTVHFAKSHHSRLIQLADVYLYFRQFHKLGETTPWRKAICQVIMPTVLSSSFQRDWPQERRWYQTG